MSYRIESAKQGRAHCKQQSTCGKDKINKGELRLGTWVEIGGNGSWAWKHWGCVTAKVIDNMANVYKSNSGEMNMDLMDGWEELPDEGMKSKVKKALEQGYVDDEDWKGDAGGNRPNPPRKPTKKKGKRGQDDEDEDPEEEKEDDQEAEEKPKAKRGRPAKKAVEKTADEEPKTSAPKRGSRAKKDASKEGDEDAKPAGRRGRSSIAKADDEVLEKEPKKAPAKRGRAKAEAAPEEAEPEEANEEDKIVEEEKPKARGGRKKAEPKPAAAAGRKRKAAAPAQEELNGADEEKTEEPKRKRGRPAKNKDQ